MQYNTEQIKNHKITVQCIVVVTMCKFQQYTVMLRGRNSWAILPNKTQATYVELFMALHQALIELFGDIGENHTFLTDFELAEVFHDCEGSPMSSWNRI